MSMNKSSITYKGKTYPVVEITNFHTADDIDVAFGMFTSEDFMDLNDESSEYRTLDDKIYGYLPNTFLTKGTEEEIKEYIRYNIG